MHWECWNSLNFRLRYLIFKTAAKVLYKRKRRKITSLYIRATLFTDLFINVFTLCASKHKNKTAKSNNKILITSLFVDLKGNVAVQTPLTISALEHLKRRYIVPLNSYFINVSFLLFGFLTYLWSEENYSITFLNELL